MEPTRSQKAAIETDNRNILVSAAAGSGKTATLTKRIIRLLTDNDSPVSLSEMLVVTFTNTAAAELKSRITSALTEALLKDPGNLHIAAELTSVNSASISTIDAFYLSLVKENFQRLDIPSTFRICDSDETSTLKADILNDLINRMHAYDADKDDDSLSEFGINKGDFTQFSDTFTSIRDDSSLEEIIDGISEKLKTVPAGIGYLKHCAEEYAREAVLPFNQSRAGKYIYSELKSDYKNYLLRVNECIETANSDENCSKYLPSFEYLRAYLEEMTAAIDSGSYENILSAAYGYVTPPTVRVSRKTETSTILLDEKNCIAKAIADDISNYFPNDAENLKAIILCSSRFCNLLYYIIGEYQKRLSSEKLSRQCLDFDDLRKYTLKLLIDSDGNPTDIAETVKQRYKYIFVDEYQDTDGMQDLIFRTVSNGKNLFIVGDIKQSIYSFRGAEPGLFASYRKLWPLLDDIPHTNEACSIYMSENFRCAENIVNFSNSVCSYLFRASEDDGHCGIGYKKEDDLLYSRIGEDSHTPAKIVFCERNPKPIDPSTGKPSRKSDGTDPEGEYISNEILRIVNEERKPDGSPYKFGDIAVLARKNDTLSLIAGTMAQKGIPLNNADGELLFENPEVLLFYSILSAVDNPQRDIPLAAAMKSPFFGFSLTDIVKIRMGRTKVSLYDSVTDYSVDGDDLSLSKRCAEFLDRLNYLRKRSEAIPVDRFIRTLWSESEAMSYAGCSSLSSSASPEDKRKNLRMLYDYALHFESGEFRTLHDFVLYISDILQRDKEIKVVSHASANAVQLLTVHKSKGLEYPVVFIAGTTHQFSNKDSSSPFLLINSGDIGFASKVAHSSGCMIKDSPLRLSALYAARNQSLEEEIRILYVALTRARELLYITSSGEDGYGDSRIRKALQLYKHGKRKSIFDANCWLDWILTSTNTHLYVSSYKTECVHPFENKLSSELPEERNNTPVSNEAYVSQIIKQLKYEYPYTNLSGIPSKVSVSKLYPGFLDEDDTDEALDRRIESMTPKTPKFTETGASAGEKGTATHLFLQFCDFSAINSEVDSVKREAQRLVDRKFIPPETLSLIRYDELAKFAESDLFIKIKKAKEIHRETRFNIYLPASDFITDPGKKQESSDAKIFVQGVIDLFFTDENGKTVLCDYKTDRFTKEELESPQKVCEKMESAHSTQLRYYAMSLERLTGHYPDEILVYPLQYGKAVKININ